MMSTTIQVDRRTLQLLELLKKKLSVKSYNEVLKIVLSEKLNIPTSMFGSNPKLLPFKKEDEAEFHEL